MKIPIWKVVLFFLIILGVGALLLPTQRELGRVFLAERDYPEAEEYLEKQYLEHPEDISNSLRYLESLDHTLDFERYEEVANSLLQKYPNDPRIHRAVAAYYENNLRPDDAAAQWEAAVKLDPDDIESRQKLISYYRLTKKYDSLIALYEQMMAQGTANESDYFELGRLYSLRGQNEDAARVYAALLTKEPKSPVAKVRLAELWESQGRIDEALALYEAAAESDPTNRDYAILYMEKAFEYGRGPAATTAMARYLKRFPDDEQLQIEVAYRMVGEGMTDQALQILQDLHRRDPTQPDAVQMMADIYHKQGKNQETIDLLVPYLQVAPPDYKSRVSLGDALTAVGRPDEAKQQYSQALDILDSEKVLSIDEHLDQIDLREKVLGVKPTPQELQQLYAAHPDSSSVASLTFYSALEQGDIALAQQAYERVETLDSTNSDLPAMAAALLLAQKKWPEAVQAYAALVESGQANQYQLQDYATALLEAGDYEEAYEVVLQLYERNPADLTLLQHMNYLLTQKKRYTLLLDLLCRFAQTNPLEPISYILIGDAQSALHCDEAAEQAWWHAYEMIMARGVGTARQDRTTVTDLALKLDRAKVARYYLEPLLLAEPEAPDILALAAAAAIGLKDWCRAYDFVERLGAVSECNDLTYLGYRISIAVGCKQWCEAKGLLERMMSAHGDNLEYQHDYALVLRQLNLDPLARRILKSLYVQGERQFAWVWDMREVLTTAGNSLGAEATLFSGEDGTSYQVYREKAVYWWNDKVRLTAGANQEHYQQIGNSSGQIAFKRDIFGVFGGADCFVNTDTVWGIFGGLPALNGKVLPFVGANGLYQRNDFRVELNLLYHEIIRLPVSALPFESTRSQVLLAVENIYCNWLHLGVSGWWEWYRLNPALNPLNSESSLGDKWFLQPRIGIVAISDVRRYIELSLQFLAASWRQGFPGAETLVDLLPQQRAIQFGVVAKQRWCIAEFEGALFESWDYARRVNAVVLRSLLNLWFTGCYVGTIGFDYQIGDSGLAGLGNSWILYLSFKLVY